MSKTDHRRRVSNSDRIDSKLARKKQRTAKLVKQKIANDYYDEEIYTRQSTQDSSEPQAWD